MYKTATSSLMTVDSLADRRVRFGRQSTPDEGDAVRHFEITRDPSSTTVSTERASGGNRASLAFADPATVTISDRIDTPTENLRTTVAVTVELSEVTEDDDGIKFMFQLSNPPLGAVSLMVQVGEDVHNVLINEAGYGDLFIDTTDVDSYIDLESVTATVLSLIDGNFEDTSVAGAAATAQVTDTVDTITVILSAELMVSEGENFITYTASLSDGAVANNDVSVKLASGATIIIPAGSNSGTANVATQGDDVYLDSATVANRIVSVVEVDAGTLGSMEDLRYDGAEVETLAEDTVDKVTASLSGTVSTSAHGGSIIYTVTLTGGPGPVTPVSDLSFKLVNGETVTILAGQTSGFSSPVAVNLDIGHNETVSITNSISGVMSGGAEYENLVVDAKPVATTIVDDMDTVTVTVTATDVTENEAGVVFAFQLSSPQQGAASLAVQVGATNHTVELNAAGAGSLFIPMADSDVYLDAESVTATVLSINGGNFEDTTLEGASATAQITDVTDTTTVTLNDVAVNELAGTATITATVNHAAQTDLVITLDNGATITVGAGQTSGTSTAFPVSSHSFAVAITAAAGGNYENLDCSDTAFVFVGDGSNALSKGFWSQHVEAWDGNVATIKRGDADTQNLEKAGPQTALDVLQNRIFDVDGDGTPDFGDIRGNSGKINGTEKTGLLLGDANGNGVKDAGEDTLWVQLEAARQIIDSSASATDARQILMAHTIAAQLNIYNGVEPPNDLVGEAVRWLTEVGDVDRDNDGILDLSGADQDYSTTSKSFLLDANGDAPGTALSTKSAAWQQDAGVLDSAGIVMADGEDLNDALEYFNTNRLVVSADGDHVGWTNDGGLTVQSIFGNSIDGFWNTLDDQNKLA